MKPFVKDKVTINFVNRSLNVSLANMMTVDLVFSLQQGNSNWFVYQKAGGGGCAIGSKARGDRHKRGHDTGVVVSNGFEDHLNLFLRCNHSTLMSAASTHLHLQYQASCYSISATTSLSSPSPYLQ